MDHQRRAGRVLRPPDGRRAGSEKAARGLQPLNKVLSGILGELGLTKEVARQRALERWEGVVGEKISAVARATGVSRGILFVRVSSSAWLSELNLMRADILRRLNAGQEDARIDRIVFSLEPEPDSPPRSGSRGTSGDD